jgi:hypothetical protein
MQKHLADLSQHHTKSETHTTLSEAFILYVATCSGWAGIMCQSRNSREQC